MPSCPACRPTLTRATPIPARFDQRAPTVAFTFEAYTPRQEAEQPGLEESGGMVRVEIGRYHTIGEVYRSLAVINGLARG
jgi:hypothetical protein